MQEVGDCRFEQTKEQHLKCSAFYLFSCNIIDRIYSKTWLKILKQAFNFKVINIENLLLILSRTNRTDSILWKFSLLPFLLATKLYKAHSSIHDWARICITILKCMRTHFEQIKLITSSDRDEQLCISLRVQC